MGSINVRIPDDQKKEIEETAEEQNYPSPSEWVREAIREKLKRDLIAVRKQDGTELMTLEEARQLVDQYEDSDSSERD